MIFGSDGRYTIEASRFVKDAREALENLRISSEQNYGLELSDFVYLVHQTLSDVCDNFVLDTLLKHQESKEL